MGPFFLFMEMDHARFPASLSNLFEISAAAVFLLCLKFAFSLVLLKKINQAHELVPRLRTPRASLKCEPSYLIYSGALFF